MPIRDTVSQIKYITLKIYRQLNEIILRISNSNLFVSLSNLKNVFIKCSFNVSVVGSEKCIDEKLCIDLL